MSIYKIYFDDILLYIGSTFDLDKRKILHKSALNTSFDMPLYRFLRENYIEFEDLNWVEIITDVEDKKILREYEGDIIREYRPLCNIRIDCRTTKEYKAEHKDYYREKAKEWRLKNVDRYKEKHKEGDKLRYLKNPEKYRKQGLEYYHKNREEINRKRREKTILKNQELTK